MPDKFTDKSLMTIGQYKGQQMQTIPSWYLIRIYEMQYSWVPAEVSQYVKDNETVLRYQIKHEKR